MKRQRNFSLSSRSRAYLATLSEVSGCTIPMFLVMIINWATTAQEPFSKFDRDASRDDLTAASFESELISRFDNLYKLYEIESRSKALDFAIESFRQQGIDKTGIFGDPDRIHQALKSS
ncbi:hypothetical protein [Pseudodesulfovibrio karagichevae]|uniref:Uncharacterized protein n=1 Tax=Pseudodesulfovibrio karagichevae TaxID=3239305 RepID=A0ABV4K4I3_9BACT